MSYLRLTVASHRIALLAGCAFAASGLVLSAAPAMAGCNSGNSPNSYLLSNASCQADASGEQATAVGLGAVANNFGAVALGIFARAQGRNSTAIGSRSGPFDIPVEGATTVGQFAGATGAGIYSTAIGAGDFTPSSPHARGGYSIAIGGGENGNFPGALANGFRAISIGQRSTTGDGSGFTGFGLGDFGTSVGFNTHTAFAATAVGTDAQAKGNSSSAFGRFGTATGASSVALGHGATASHSQSVALGALSVTTGANVVSVGNGTLRRRIVLVAPAVSNTDAPNLGQVKAIATTAAQAEIASAGVSTSMINDMRRELSDLRVLVKQQQQELVELKAGKISAALGE